MLDITYLDAKQILEETHPKWLLLECDMRYSLGVRSYYAVFTAKTTNPMGYNAKDGPFYSITYHRHGPAGGGTYFTWRNVPLDGSADLSRTAKVRQCWPQRAMSYGWRTE